MHILDFSERVNLNRRITNKNNNDEGDKNNNVLKLNYLIYK